jgi:pyruvate,water dikinase
MAEDNKKKFILWFDEISIGDVPLVGGKSASLGEMYQKVQERGKNVRSIIRNSEFPPALTEAILDAYRKMEEHYGKGVDVAVRSSATAEDLPDASFAGQQETFLNIRGEEVLIDACKRCFASLFTNRAISYRHDKGFGQFDVYLSIAVQKMVRSDKASAGVIFSIDTETGFKDVVFITASYGLGENVVKGAVNPDEYYVFKPTLLDGKRPIVEKRLGGKNIKMIYTDNPKEPTKDIETTEEERRRFTLEDDDILTLARWTCIIEDHYQKPMDIEWAKDGEDGELFIVQARPETVHSQAKGNTIETYVLKETGTVIITGQAVGTRIGQGNAHIIEDSAHIGEFKKGEVLVTTMTDPDWEPIMKIASAIVTNKGGRTCHAAIISREMGITCIIGTDHATETISTGQPITVSCAQGDIGSIYEGLLKFDIERVDLENIPQTKTKIMMNVGIPENAFKDAQIPNDGVGLAREEFIINSHIGIHPLALIHYEELKGKDDPETKEIVKKIDKMTAAYKGGKEEFFINKLAMGIARIGAAFYPNDVIVRLSDFKTNEYSNLIGGHLYEPVESNPMIGWRGASRYYDEKFKEAFGLECKALIKVRGEMGLTNIKVMVPFCRTPEEGKKVIATMAEFGLVQGENDLELYVMCEIPSNVISAESFADIFDGFSIGSNDLTQLTLGLDRDSDLVSHIFDERNDAVKDMVRKVIEVARKRGKKIGICGQAPSDFPEFATFLVECGIDSISLIPDTVIKTKLAIAKKEKELGIT